MCSFLRTRPISLSMNNCSSTDSLRIFGRSLFLAVVGLSLQGGTKIRIFYRTSYSGRPNDSTRKKLMVLYLVFFDFSVDTP